MWSVPCVRPRAAKLRRRARGRISEQQPGHPGGRAPAGRPRLLRFLLLAWSGLGGTHAAGELRFTRHPQTSAPPGGRHFEARMLAGSCLALSGWFGMQGLILIVGVLSRDSCAACQSTCSCHNLDAGAHSLVVAEESLARSYGVLPPLTTPTICGEMKWLTAHPAAAAQQRSLPCRHQMTALRPPSWYSRRESFAPLPSICSLVHVRPWDSVCGGCDAMQRTATTVSVKDLAAVAGQWRG